MTSRDHSAHTAAGDDPLCRDRHWGSPVSARGRDFPKVTHSTKGTGGQPRLSHLPRLLILVTLCTRSHGWSRLPRGGSHLVLGRVTKLLSVLDLSMPGPPSPNAWDDQEDRPCPRPP